MRTSNPSFPEKDLPTGEANTASCISRVLQRTLRLEKFHLYRQPRNKPSPADTTIVIAEFCFVLAEVFVYFAIYVLDTLTCLRVSLFDLMVGLPLICKLNEPVHFSSFLSDSETLTNWYCHCLGLELPFWLTTEMQISVLNLCLIPYKFQMLVQMVHGEYKYT